MLILKIIQNGDPTQMVVFLFPFKPTKNQLPFFWWFGLVVWWFRSGFPCTLYKGVQIPNHQSKPPIKGYLKKGGTLTKKEVAYTFCSATLQPLDGLPTLANHLETASRRLLSGVRRLSKPEVATNRRSKYPDRHNTCFRSRIFPLLVRWLWVKNSNPQNGLPW